MKKLFLYFILFAGIFILCYLLANAYFGQRTRNESETSQESARDSISIDVENENQDSMSFDVKNDKGKYVVGLQDARVVVYQNDTGQIFEYADIDVEVIRRLHPDMYERLQKRQVYFDSEQALYRYLESLST